MGVPVGVAKPWLAHGGRSPILGCWRSWVDRVLLALLVVPSPGGTRNPSHDVLAPLGPKGPISAPPRLQQGPSSAPGLEGLILTTIICMAPLDSSWHPSSPPGSAQPIVAAVISTLSSWTHHDVHQQLLLLLDSSWNSLSPPPSPGPILASTISSRSRPAHLSAFHLCLALLDPSWHLSCLSGPAGTVLVLIMSSWFSWNHLDAHHLCLFLPRTSAHHLLLLLHPSWSPSSLLYPARYFLASLMSFWSSWIHLGAHHLLLLLPK